MKIVTTLTSDDVSAIIATAAGLSRIQVQVPEDTVVTLPDEFDGRERLAQMIEDQRYGSVWANKHWTLESVASLRPRLSAITIEDGTPSEVVDAVLARAVVGCIVHDNRKGAERRSYMVKEPPASSTPTVFEDVLELVGGVRVRFTLGQSGPLRLTLEQVEPCVARTMTEFGKLFVEAFEATFPGELAKLMAEALEAKK